jgi:hypothetical protein
MTTRHRTVAGTALAGRICCWGGLLGALQSVVLLLVPPAVGEDRVSYPFSSAGYVAAQLSSAVQHALLLVGVLALLRVAGPVSRAVLVALLATAAGLALITVAELAVVAAADMATDDPFPAWFGVLYGIPTVLIGLGLLVAGAGIGRAGCWTGWRRWITLALGAYVAVVLIPLIDTTFAIGQLVLGGWMLLFAGLGLALTRDPR